MQNNECAYLFDTNFNLIYDMFSYETGKINRYGIKRIYKYILDVIYNYYSHLNNAQLLKTDNESSTLFRDQK